jgi:DNA-binding response OmpR family regulator
VHIQIVNVQLRDLSDAAPPAMGSRLASQHTALLRDAWGTDYAGGSNVIEVLPGSLRRKLGDRAPAIETVRGMGYRFIAPA